MKPGLLQAVTLLAVLGIDEKPPLRERLDAVALPPERERPRPVSNYTPEPRRPRPPSPYRRVPVDAAGTERVRLADEKRRRKAAKLEALAAKGAIKRAGVAS